MTRSWGRVYDEQYQVPKPSKRFFPSYPRETTAGAIVAEYGTGAAVSILTQLCDVLDDMVAVHEWRRVANAIDVIADAPPQELTGRFRIRTLASQLTHDPVKRRRQALATTHLVILLRTLPRTSQRVSAWGKRRATARSAVISVCRCIAYGT